MAATQIRGSTQIMSGSISADRLDFTPIRADGTNAFAAAQSMGNFKLTSVAAPADPGDAVNKAYVDALTGGFDFKGSCRLATTENINLSSAPATIDSVAPSQDDRILVKDQTTASQNGIYVYNGSGSAMTRATDFDADAEVTAGALSVVEEGTTNADTWWFVSSNNPITVGSSDIAFTQMTSAADIVDGDGLGKTGNTLSVNVDNSSIEISTDTLQVKAAGITESHLATSVAGDGLTGGGGSALAVNVDNSTLEISTDTLQVKALGIANSHVATAAAIALSKLASGTDAQIIVGNISGVPTYVSLSGDATLANTGALSLGSDTVQGSELDTRKETRTSSTSATWVLAATPFDDDHLQVFKNGILLTEGGTEDYTRTAATITFTSAPATEDRTTAIYQV